MLFTRLKSRPFLKGGGPTVRLVEGFDFLPTIYPPVSLRLTAADGGRPLCHSVTSPHTVGSHPLGKGALFAILLDTTVCTG